MTMNRSRRDEALMPAKPMMATILLTEGDTLTAADAKRLAKAAIGLNRELGDPTDI
jgi:hypothetical protein